MRRRGEVAEKNIRNAEQELKREKRRMQQARERAARRAGTAARNVKNAGLPRIVAGRSSATPRSRRARRTRRTPRESTTPRPARRGRPGPARRADDRAGRCPTPTCPQADGLRRRGIADQPWRPRAFRGRRPDDPRTRTDRPHRAERGRQVHAPARHQRRPRSRTTATSSAPTAGSPTCPSGWTCSTSTAPSRRTSSAFAPSLSDDTAACTCWPASCSAAAHHLPVGGAFRRRAAARHPGLRPLRRTRAATAAP